MPDVTPQTARELAPSYLSFACCVLQDGVQVREGDSSQSGHGSSAGVSRMPHMVC